MARTIGLLFVIAVPAFLFHQTLGEMPVRLILRAIRTGYRRIANVETEVALRLRMYVEYIRKDVVGRLVLPDPGIPAKSQQMQPGRKGQLARNELPVAAEALYHVDVAMDGTIAAIVLLYPQRHRLCNQLFQFDIVTDRQAVHGIFIPTTQPFVRHDALWQKNVLAQRRRQL
ncbi:hypothetical protein GCM10007388_16040 [Pseudoduganella plicata]|uniref:Uncharacterized protein n=1 Tax=Pseudoduganella plicata TaxID=321984 RepID=A0AA87YB53_9BURK|nr:hypothetical protein GCM10007388_16040 [Pseudoduganella plicata]